MISYFSQIYPDEILYSIIARYHNYSGNVGLKSTLVDIFSNVNVIPTIEFPSHISLLNEQISWIFGFESFYLIDKHTMFPYYKPFLPIERQESVLDKMVTGDGKGIKMEIGYIAGSLCAKQDLAYCPACVVSDVENYGEAYFHRIHQAQGVFVCPEHKCLLKPYPVRLIDVSRISFISLQHKDINLSVQMESDSKKQSVMLNIANNASYLLNNNLPELNQNTIHEIYLSLLNRKGFLSVNGGVSQRDLCQSMIHYYGEEILTAFKSDIEIDNEYNWVKVLTRKQRRVVHPVRHLLFLNFLGESIESISTIALKSKRSFYPCLNPTSSHYKKLVIGSVKITADYKTREPVGTFKCSCGFIYSRKMAGNIYKIGRVKEYGLVWESKLKDLVTAQRLSVSAIAKELRCDYKTVVRYASKIGLKHLINTSMCIEFNYPLKGPQNKNQSLLKRYEEDVIYFVRENPDANYSLIRDNFKKEFSYIYHHDKEWLNINIPKVNTHKNGSFRKVGIWEKRDYETQMELQNIYSELNINGTKKISKTMIMRKTGKLAMLEKNIDKLPLCNSFLSKIQSKGRLMKRVSIVQ